MLTMKGHIGPMMVNTPGLNQANTEKPKLTPEEEEKYSAVRSEVEDVGGFPSTKLHHQEMYDRSGAIVGGRISTPNGWVDADKYVAPPINATNKQTARTARGEEPPQAKKLANKGPPDLGALLAKGLPGKGKPGAAKGKGGGGLGDLFAGGMKPNAGALKGGSGAK